MIEEVRKDAIDALRALLFHNPPKYQLVMQQIIDVVRTAPLTKVAGPEEE